jgi:lysophospholipase
MFGIAPPIPIWLARIMLNLNLVITKLRGKKASYFIGESNYQAFPFDKNRLTHSEIRYKLFKQAYAEFPQVQLGGVTSWWVVQALSALEYIQENAHHISLPCLVLRSGGDLIVSNDAIDEIHQKLKDSEILTIENAMHELLFEKDSMREQCLNAIEQFLSR